MLRIVTLIFTLLLLLGWTSSAPEQPLSPDIVIIGGDFPACAAARNAAAAAPNKKVLLVVPDPVYQLGGIGTVGGQNFMDIRKWKNQLVTGGSFSRWYDSAGQFYNTDEMSQIINNDLAQFPNLNIMYGYDIEDLKLDGNIIREVKFRNIHRNENGLINWGSSVLWAKGQIFIDASVDGRLTYMGRNMLNIGRGDWPQHFLPTDEKPFLARQQAASLMFKVTGVKTPPTILHLDDWEFSLDKEKGLGLTGGKKAYISNPEVVAFNNKYGPMGFSIKPINAATMGKDHNTWWVNCLLVFNVDARAHQRDQGTNIYPRTLSGQLNQDEAWIKARTFLKNPEFIKTLQQFRVQDPTNGQWYGFQNASLVLDKQGQPEVGQVMYIRESAHSTKVKSTEQDKENSLFAVTTKECQSAGTDEEGADRQNYPNRIGLGYYMMDINAYTPGDLNISGNYDWPVTGHLRPDWQAAGGEPKNPVYLPLDALIPSTIENLLVPGYAAGISSFAWAELRVLPNLTVLGDAAGVAAVRYLDTQVPPKNFSQSDITWVQKKLSQLGARLEK